MRKTTALFLVTTAVMAAGCTSQSGVKTTPTYAPARFLPGVGVDTAGPVVSESTRQAWANRGQASPKVATSKTTTGIAAVAQANRSAVVRPSSASMRGATWVIDAHDPTKLYEIPVKAGWSTTILMPPGERFNGGVTGDTRNFAVFPSYSGPRPTLSLVPLPDIPVSNLQVLTTGDFYGFILRPDKAVALNSIDINHADARTVTPSAGADPTPQGDFTPLAMVEVDDQPLPAWTPAEAWADSSKMVLRFAGPLPTLPALLAGQKGEQMINYRRTTGGDGSVYLVTDRRVTEARLLLDEQAVDLTVDPTAIGVGAAADPSLGAQGWRSAPPLPAMEM